MIAINVKAFLPEEEFAELNKEIRLQAKEGIIVLPAYCEAIAEDGEDYTIIDANAARKVADLRAKIEELEQILEEREEPEARSKELAQKLGATIHIIGQMQTQVHCKDGAVIDISIDKWKDHQWAGLDMTLEELRLVNQIVHEHLQRREKNEGRTATLEKY